jgi:hypothetical protein
MRLTRQMALLLVAVGIGEALVTLDADEEEELVALVVGILDAAGRGTFVTWSPLPVVEEACIAGETISSSTVACLDACVGHERDSLGTEMPLK